MSSGTVHLYVDADTKVKARTRPAYDGEPLTYLSVTEGQIDVCFSGPAHQLRALLDRLVIAAAVVKPDGLEVIA